MKRNYHLSILPRLIVLTAVIAANFIFDANALRLQRAVPSSGDLAKLGLEEHTLNVANQRRWFLVKKPINTKAVAPVIVLLHGGSGSMRKLFLRRSKRVWLDIADREKALLLVPNGTNAKTGSADGDRQFWNDLRERSDFLRSHADDVGFITSLLHWAHNNHYTDRRRVFVTGISNGGMMVYRLLIEVPEQFTAAAAFIAALPTPADQLEIPSQPTPIMIMNGTDDPLVKWSGGIVGRNRGRVLSAEETVGWWIKVNRAHPEHGSIELIPDINKEDNCRIERRDYRATSEGAAVIFYTMRGGGHAPPTLAAVKRFNPAVRRYLGNVCRDAEGAELAWSFFASNTR